MRLTALTLTTALVAVSPARADVPNVVTDIPAVHSLVAQIMDGVGAPKLLMTPGASPHSYSMRPSEAAVLQNADLVFWIGEDLTPWLHESVETLAADARSVELLEADGSETLEFREGHDKDRAEGEHDHDKDHAEGEHDHDKDHADADGHEGHDHEGIDPHAWLDPQNAIAWLRLIADELSTADPDNAAAYGANLEASLKGLKVLAGEIETTVAPVRGKPFIVFHDAYHYFEHRFEVETVGAVSLSDASQPSAQRVDAIRHLIEDEGVVCVFTEPQFEPKLVQTVIEGTSTRTAVLDPVGAELALGKDLYGNLLTGLASSMAGCLSN